VIKAKVAAATELSGVSEFQLRNLLRSLQDRNKNGDEFVAFLPES
jgi:hypothetical protein